jgi:hypothetical protein
MTNRFGFRKAYRNFPERRGMAGTLCTPQILEPDCRAGVGMAIAGHPAPQPLMVPVKAPRFPAGLFYVERDSPRPQRANGPGASSGWGTTTQCDKRMTDVNKLALIRYAGLFISSKFNTFTHPNCRALYQIIKVEAGPITATMRRRWRSSLLFSKSGLHSQSSGLQSAQYARDAA